MSTRKYLTLPTGWSIYAGTRDDNRYYVDKTPYLKPVFTDPSPVLFLIRPRRYGKTLLMDMFSSFLSINRENPGDTSFQQKYFKDTKIYEDKEFCRKFMGQYPVIELSLQSVHGRSFEFAYIKLSDVISNLASGYRYLLKSKKLEKKDKDDLDKISSSFFLSEDKNADYLKNSLSIIARLLYKEYGKPAIILVNKYDAPFAEAMFTDFEHNVDSKEPDHSFLNDFQKRMEDLLSDIFGLLKANSKDKGLIKKVVISGYMDLSKTKIFEGVDDIKVNTVFSKDPNLSGCIGFTVEEADKFLKDYDLEEYQKPCRKHYAGYRFFDKEMVSPWTVVSFIYYNFSLKQRGETRYIWMDRYWAGTCTSSQDEEYLGLLTDCENQKVQDLVDGKSICFKFNDKLKYDSCIANNPDDLWTLLLFAGYLTVDWDKTNELTDDSLVYVRIPNFEILGCLANTIKHRFRNKILLTENFEQQVISSFVEGKSEDVKAVIEKILSMFIDIRIGEEHPSKKSYYHKLFHCLLKTYKLEIGFFEENLHDSSKAEFIFSDYYQYNVALIETEVALEEPVNDKALTSLSEMALNRIKGNKYYEKMLSRKSDSHIYAYGIAFSGKKCAVSVKQLK